MMNNSNDKSSYLFAGVLCVSLLACTASIKPALKTSVDSQLSHLKNSNELVAATDAAPGYQPGQWLQYRIVNEKGEPTIATYKYLSTESGTHAIETVIESYYNRSASYMEIDYEIGAPIDTLEILRVISSDDVNTTPSEAGSIQMSMLRSTYEAMAQQLFVNEINTSGTAEVSVVAGTFQSSYERDTTIRWGPWSYQAHSWHHPALPMHGMVKAQRTDGTETSTELIAYGLSGAQSEILGVLR